MTNEPGDVLRLTEHADFPMAVPTPDHFLPLLYLAGLAFEEAANASQAQGNNHLAVLAIGHLGHVHFHQGRLRQSEIDFRRALDIDRQMSTRPSPFSGIALAGLGNTFYEWNERERSLQYFQESLALARPWRNWEGLLPALTGLARLKGARGDWQGAQADLEELEDHELEHIRANYRQLARDARESLKHGGRDTESPDV